MLELVDTERDLRTPVKTNLSPEDLARHLPAFCELLEMMQQPGPLFSLEDAIHAVRKVKSLGKDGQVQITIRDNYVLCWQSVRE